MDQQTTAFIPTDDQIEAQKQTLDAQLTALGETALNIKGDRDRLRAEKGAGDAT